VSLSHEITIFSLIYIVLYHIILCIIYIKSMKPVSLIYSLTSVISKSILSLLVYSFQLARDCAAASLELKPQIFAYVGLGWELKN